MLSTVILDAYTKEETDEMCKAINDLCSPNDNWGWSSSGIYCYWDYYTKEILYIGLASDLTTRFKQHNGIMNANDSSSKWKYIKKYFDKKEKIGITIILQSPLNQPVVSRNKGLKFSRIFETDVKNNNYAGYEGKESIKLLEGQLIKVYELKHGRLPKWNIINGSIQGQSTVNIISYEIFDSINHLNPYLTAKSTIRELEKNPKYCYFESWLHGVRYLYLKTGLGYNQLLIDIGSQTYKITKVDIYKNILQSGYLNKKLKI